MNAYLFLSCNMKEIQEKKNVHSYRLMHLHIQTEQSWWWRVERVCPRGDLNTGQPVFTTGWGDQLASSLSHSLTLLTAGSLPPDLTARPPTGSPHLVTHLLRTAAVTAMFTQPPEIPVQTISTRQK